MDILTNVPVPIGGADEILKLNDILPDKFDQMVLAGAVPGSHADRAACYPELFKTAEAAKQAWKHRGRKGVSDPYINSSYRDLTRVSGNPDQLPARRAASGNQLLTAEVDYRIEDQRGPSKSLWFDAERIEPLSYLQEHLGQNVKLVGSVSPIHHPFDTDGEIASAELFGANDEPILEATADVVAQPTENRPDQSSTHAKKIIDGIRKLLVEPIATDRDVIDCDDGEFETMWSIDAIAKECGLSRSERRRICRGKDVRRLSKKERERTNLMALIQHVGVNRFADAVATLTGKTRSADGRINPSA